MPLAAKLREPVEEREVAVEVGVGRGGVELLVLGVHVRADLQKQHRRLHVSGRRGGVDGRALARVPDVHVGAPLDQPAYAVQVVVVRRAMQPRLAVLVARVDLHPICVQELHHVVAAVLSHDVEGSIALPCPGRQLGTPPVAELGQAHVAGVARVFQQRLLRLHIVGVDLGRLQEALQHIHEHRAVPGDDLFQVESVQLFLGRLEGGLEVREGVAGLLAGLAVHEAAAGGVKLGHVLGHG
mmetsp:Transcript_72360/g.233902  ORF Transcript_72360/g.233902 Transcript_72360/m.233902 type:complete len:240 (-) Transcript_72360:1292-2011(-)